jgi:hypothetical protein
MPRLPRSRGGTWLLAGAVWLAACAGLWTIYVRTHPLVFMPAHEHCITYAELKFGEYAAEHAGRYPFDAKGYASALLMMDEDCFNTLTGPGYDPAPLVEAKRAGRELSEEDCGRVYIQGLTKQSNPKLAMLFDKLATPGGDHCYLPFRLWFPLRREVLMVGTGSHVAILEADWPEFSRGQVDLLVQEGWDRKEAERLYASKPKWDAPPGLPFAWFASGAALLALPIVLIARRRVRRLRAA